MRAGALRRGDLVEVRSAGDILSTLDEHGALDAMPFMPEMVPFIGRRFTVSARADKICDTIGATLQSREMHDTVLLDDLRCDGAAHGGCQADCRFYWNEAWLKKVDTLNAPVAGDDAGIDALLACIGPAVRKSGEGDGDDVIWRCQVTETNAASIPLSTTNPRPYFNELRTRNVPPVTWARMMARAAYMQTAWKLDVLHPPSGPHEKSPQVEPLDLQKGEWVRVKPREEIEQTLTKGGKHRGLNFDLEMAPFCGQVMQVRDRVTHIIEEPTGKMLHFGNDCIKIDGAVCSGERSTGRYFCPRQIFPYWREAWLERVEGPDGPVG